jgi:hypothetical protein
MKKNVDFCKTCHFGIFFFFFNEKNAEAAFFHEHIFGQANIHGIRFIKTGLKLDPNWIFQVQMIGLFNLKKYPDLNLDLLTRFFINFKASFLTGF